MTEARSAWTCSLWFLTHGALKIELAIEVGHAQTQLWHTVAKYLGHRSVAVCPAAGDVSGAVDRGGDTPPHV